MADQAGLFEEPPLRQEHPQDAAIPFEDRWSGWWVTVDELREAAAGRLPDRWHRVSGEILALMEPPDA